MAFSADLWSGLLLLIGVAFLVTGLLVASRRSAADAVRSRWLVRIGAAALLGGISLTILGIFREVTR
ncbi:MAG: hypothetical protein ING44_18355 [Telmatospirillum sp.]|nr:hypothetical protein [Telmatospirillum sp.]